MARQETRFGFGHATAVLGAVVAAGSVTQPWLKLDLAEAFRIAVTGSSLPQAKANDILYTGSHVPQSQVDTSPQVAALARTLGIESTGLEQLKIAAIAVLVLAVIAVIAVARSVVADTAWAARAPAPWVAISGFGCLLAAALQLWVFAPDPVKAMKPDQGLWMLVGGGVLLLLGALTLGNNRRRPFLDDFDGGPGSKNFDQADHLAYSHGAWVPRGAADTER